ncbi:carbamoyltransferase [Candidatus Uabimicrobium amorphum]|uniref:Carbamoyltransferase n=2 Tax=Uabimicrobium amorphum TaxID=2596890 RepID=A0A5S9IU96_UABAM|nr:carbamoyltransferase HypF [Candidatus Uabimicrobium amorphum]BBM88253.1 carbamoyltransferase [Candidatus Uabimicrobium amorphum]
MQEDFHHLSIVVKGIVQGVGFRPFVYHLAKSLNVHGYVRNSTQGVMIEIEGPKKNTQEFLQKLSTEKPRCAWITHIQSCDKPVVGYRNFEIEHSTQSSMIDTVILPDMSICGDCLNEIFDPLNRRYRYPFTNCTNCGPRYSIITKFPYDRENTTMDVFSMCQDCRDEYTNPQNRRFHAQPNACHACGPHLQLLKETGEVISTHDAALCNAVEAIRCGEIVAVKGLGGFHFVVDATNEAAVKKLREKKQRFYKPFAIMYPNLQSVKNDCFVSQLEENLLISPESPIVLLRHKNDVYPWVAPQNLYYGVMLPYTPLHALIIHDLQRPIVVTSGNRSHECICTQEDYAIQTLGNVASLFLVHNRKIAHHADDSIVRVVMGREMVMRRARGYAPRPILLKRDMPSTLAVGGDLKNSIALSVANNVFISPYLGDLQVKTNYEAFCNNVSFIQKIYATAPQSLIGDAHPGYCSNYLLNERENVVRVQHHHAHILSCMAEYQLHGPVLGLAWDGSGYGLDATVWGGEFLEVNNADFRRTAHFRRFCLPGGEKAVTEPRRCAAGLLFEIYGEQVFDLDLPVWKTFSAHEKQILQAMLKNKINAPQTSSVGRIFDAVASLLNLCQQQEFEGQAAMLVEFLAEEKNCTAYPVALSKGEFMEIDWEPMLREIVDDITKGVCATTIATKFHLFLIEAAVRIARRVAIKNVVLSGGCFQNKYLLEGCIRQLRREGFSVYWHREIPTNDEGISLGQIYACYLQQNKGDL